MNPRILHKTTFLLLLVYVPLILSVGLLHTDDLYMQGKDRDTVQQSLLHGSERTSESGICFACLFASGQLAQPALPIPHQSFTTYVAAPIILLAPQIAPELSLARAPPLAFFS